MKPARPYVNPFDEPPPDRGEGVALLAFLVLMLGMVLWAAITGGARD